MPNALGLKSYMQVGLESVWGTNVAATRRMGIISYRPDPGIEQILDDTLEDSVARTSVLQGAKRPRFRVRTHLDYLGHLLLWDALFGTASYGSIGGTTTGANPYVHTYIERAYLNSMTVQVVAGNIPVGKCDRFLGAKIVGATIEMAIGNRPGTVDWEFVAKAYETDQTPTGALTAAARDAAIFHEATTVDDGTTDALAELFLRNFRMELRTPFVSEPYLGSLSPDEPERDNFVEPKISGTKIYRTKTTSDHGNNFTTGSPKLVLGSATTRRITFDFGSAKIATHTHEVRGYGRVMEDFEWTAFKDPTNLSALKLTIEDAVATIS